ncbi:MAG: Fpg/Nei family DNA glycosylase [Gemmatimonadetes bacterium]|nr:Fpg/Nei family DNA glycosylase [Gemmatimonadota bacterium]
MPEGHTIHHLTGKIDRWFAGQKLAATSPQGRFADGARILNGQKLNGAEAKGKHAFLHFEEGRSLHFHLGLFGRTRFRANPAPEPRGQIRLRLVGDKRTFDLSGPNRCEVLGSDEVREAMRRLGPDPLRKESRLAQFRGRLAKTRRSIGAVLLDQSVIAGIGNVYRSELLFLGGIDPRTPANALGDDDVRALWRNAVRLLRIGKKHDQIRVLGETGLLGPAGGEDVDPAAWTITSRWGPRQDRVWVYKRSCCKVCDHGIAISELGNRKLYSCPACQQGE